jgi:hypothetical protein
MRHPNILRTLLAGALLLALLPALAQAREKVEDRRVATGALAADGTLDVAVINGKIEIATWSRDEARIETTLKVQAGSEARAREVLNAVTIDVRRDGDRLVIRTDQPRGMDGGLFGWLTGNQVQLSVSHRITIPDGADAVLETVNGSIDVMRAGGAVRAETTNGGIQLAQVAGPIDAATTNGGIVAELTESPGRDMELGTVNGGITLRVAPGVSASIDASTVNGGLSVDERLDFALRDKGRRSLVGDLAGGGAEIEIGTVNGGVKIRPIG